MLKKDVILRNEVYTVFSSEKQERMKVYFQLSEDYEKCKQKCVHYYDQERDKCQTDCEQIFDQYSDILKTRYQGENKERIQMEVQNLPSYNAQIRPGRDSLFYSVFGQTWEQFKGNSDYEIHRPSDDFKQ